MANPLFNGNILPMAGGNNQMINSVVSMLKAAKGDPNAAIQMLASKNPQAFQQIQMLIKGGQNPMEVVMSMFKQRGIDPQQIMQAVNSVK